MPLDPTYGPLYRVAPTRFKTSGGDSTGRHRVVSVDVFDGTIHAPGGGTMHALPTYLAPLLPVSNFCHCFSCSPVLCAPRIYLRAMLGIASCIPGGLYLLFRGDHPSDEAKKRRKRLLVSNWK